MPNNNIIITPEDSITDVANKLYNATVPFRATYDEFLKRKSFTGESFSQMKQNRFTRTEIKQLANLLLTMCCVEEDMKC